MCHAYLKKFVEAMLLTDPLGLEKLEKTPRVTRSDTSAHPRRRRALLPELVDAGYPKRLPYDEVDASIYHPPLKGIAAFYGGKRS